MTRHWNIRLLLLGLLPLLLIVLLGSFLMRARNAPPSDSDLAISNIRYPNAGLLVFTISNGSGQAQQITVVQIDGSAWQYAIEPAQAIPTGGQATIRVLYPWTRGTSQQISVQTLAGLTAEGTGSTSTSVSVPWWRGLALLAILLLLILGSSLLGKRARRTATRTEKPKD